MPRQIGSSGKDAPPCFNVDGINYVYVRKNGMYFACTSKYNLSPALALSLLTRLAKVIKDYCGELSEDAIRKNFALIYELLNETLDFGYPQFTSTETLKAYVHNEPVLVDSARAAQRAAEAASSVGGMMSRMAGGRSATSRPSSSVNKPISLRYNHTANKSEIFVDVLERLTVLFSSSGNLVNAEIDGCIQLKSFLWGNPALSLALNADLVIASSSDAASLAVAQVRLSSLVSRLFSLSLSLSLFLSLISTPLCLYLPGLWTRPCA